MKIYRSIEKALEDWDNEEKMGDPRFVFKHAIRLRGYFLEDDNRIVNSRGQTHAVLGEVKWADENTIQATIRPETQVKFVLINIDIGKLK